MLGRMLMKGFSTNRYVSVAEANVKTTVTVKSQLKTDQLTQMLCRGEIARNGSTPLTKITQIM